MGNCLFESLNHYLKEENNYYLRLKLVDYIQKNSHIFEEDIIANGYKNVEDYCHKMEINGVDGDGVILQACVLMYEVRIKVHFSKTDKVLKLKPCKKDQQSKDQDKKKHKDQKTQKDGTIDIKKKKKTCHLQYIPGHYSVWDKSSLILSGK